MSSAYDALGRRVRRTSTTSGTTKFVYDGADVLRDLDGGGATIADYLNGPGIDNKLRQTVSGVVSYFATDNLGSTRVLTDASGNSAAGVNYDSFGNVTGGPTSTRFTYTGREIDSDTGLMYYRARWYDPQQGRFVSEDPIGLDAGINFYAYVANDSINSTDPFGLKRVQSSHRTPHTRPTKNCDCEAEKPDSEDDGFLSLMSSYGIGVARGFAGAAIGTAELPVGLVSDPVGTVDGILKDIGMRIVTLGQLAAHPVVGYDTIIDSIMVLGPNKTMEVLGDAGGQVIFFKGLAEVSDYARYGREIKIGKNCRIAPFGNRTGHPVGRWPHYHRRIVGPNGETVPGGSMKWHRPWEKGF